MEILIQPDIPSRPALLDQVVGYGIEREYDVERVSQTDSEGSNDSYSSGSGQDMDVDIQHQYNSANQNLEEEKEPVVDKLEKTNRDFF